MSLNFVNAASPTSSTNPNIHETVKKKHAAGLPPFASISHENMLYYSLVFFFFQLFYIIFSFKAKIWAFLWWFTGEPLYETSSFSGYRSFPPLFRKLPQNLLFSFQNELKFCYASQVPEKTFDYSELGRSSLNRLEFSTIFI